MRNLIVIGILVLGLFSPHASAQRAGAHGGGVQGFHREGHDPAEHHDLAEHRDRTWAGYSAGTWGFPAYYSDYGESRSYANEPASPPVVIVMAQPEAPPPPPIPIQSMTHEYNWPAPPAGSGNVFTLVSKDGMVRFAIAVWVQDGMLNYTAQDYSVGRMRPEAIDRASTLRMNAEKKLNLPLPPG